MKTQTQLVYISAATLLPFQNHCLATTELCGESLDTPC